MIYRLTNTIQNYAWGSKTALHDLFDINNPAHLPQAEMWMGAHPKASSLLDNGMSLRDMITQDKTTHLGKETAIRYGELPFLFKVLCAEQALSIQVHPSLENAKIGFDRENQQGIALDAFNRSFKDPNHKPELIYALTPFVAMNGFRPFTESANLFRPFSALDPLIDSFVSTPDARTLADMFAMILKLNGVASDHPEYAQKIMLLNSLKKHAAEQYVAKTDHFWEIFKQVEHDYPDDMGLFSLLILNVITLVPGEAMFLAAQTPHAYIQGTGLEVMANSDNVLRAGLTSKYIDVETLFSNLAFNEMPLRSLKLTSQLMHQSYSIENFMVPVDDFTFSIVTLKQSQLNYSVDSPLIIFCIDGEIQLSTRDTINHQCRLIKGESCFISEATSQLSIQGSGKIACVGNKA
jgi:mannose-6-phosphate isomerase